MTRRRILFGIHRGWTPIIAARLDWELYEPAFCAFDRVDLDAFDAVIPLSLDDYRVLEARPELRRRRFVCPRPDVAALCDDKLALAQALTRAGYGRHVPRLLTADSPLYPRVRRPRRGEFGRGARVLQTPEGAAGEDEFDQMLVPGASEYVVHVLRVGGAVRFSWALHYAMAGADLIRGEAHVPERLTQVDPAPALAHFLPILAALDYEGTCCIDFKVVGDQYLLFEINPRFGGSLTKNVNAYVAAYLGSLER